MIDPVAAALDELRALWCADGLGQQQRVFVALTLLVQKVSRMSTTLDSAIAQLQADNAALKAEIDAAPAKIATQIAAAIAAATNAGVTPAQLQSLVDLHTAFSADSAELTAALSGTSPTPAPAAPVAAPTEPAPAPSEPATPAAA